MTVMLQQRDILRLVRGLPERCQADDIIERIRLWEALQEAEADVIAGRVYTTAEVRARIGQWNRRHPAK